MNSQIRISNGHAVPVTVWLEPLGEDYTLLPGEEYRFAASGAGPEFYFHLSWQARDLQLYPEGEFQDVTVRHGQVEIYCGHHREHRTGRSF